MSPSEPEPALRLLEPPHARERGIDDPVLQVGAAVVVDARRAALVDELLGQRHRRARGGSCGRACACTPALLDRVDICSASASVLASGFSQKTTFFASAAAMRDRHVRIARRADVDDVDVFAGDDVLPGGGVLFPAQLARPPS